MQYYIYHYETDKGRVVSFEKAESLVKDYIKTMTMNYMEAMPDMMFLDEDERDEVYDTVYEIFANLYAPMFWKIGYINLYIAGKCTISSMDCKLETIVSNHFEGR